VQNNTQQFEMPATLLPLAGRAAVGVTGRVNFGHVQLNKNSAAWSTVCLLAKHYTKPVLLLQNKEKFVGRHTLARSAFSCLIQKFVLTFKNRASYI
jgi:hypothetical protein